MHAVSSDCSALLAAILVHPEEDTPRLAFADWLDEHGDANDRARAEFIRVQCQIAAIARERTELFNDETDWLRCDAESGIAASWCPNCGDCVCPDREDRMDDPACPLHALSSRHCCLFSLYRREEKQLERELAIWPCGGPEPWVDSLSPHPDCYQCIDQESIAQEADLYSPLLIYRRGFVAEVRCPLAAWTSHGPAIVRAHPVTTVRLTDVELASVTPTTHPTIYSDRTFSRTNGRYRDVIPDVIFRFLRAGEWRNTQQTIREYRSLDAGNDDVSQAAIAWAKSA